MAGRRDISPILQKIRNFLLKRENVNFLRFRDEVAARTQPPPNIPEGPNAKLAANYYYTRDGRRLVTPCEVLVEGNKVLQLSEGSDKPEPVVKRVPGKVFNWDK